MERQKSGIREYYIDNLRNFTILLLFPVHTFMVWNDFGTRFYIWQGENKVLSTAIVLINPWFMPLLFCLAGISVRYALEKRTTKEFVMERVHKLLVPFICGTIFLVPFQTLYARKYFYHYNGSFLDNWKYFFTHFTDFSGYDGAFTPGHLWFILYLFVISVVSLGVFHFVPYGRMSAYIEKMPVFGIVLLFVPVWLMYYVGNFGGFSIGKCLALYLIGYYVLSNRLAMEKLKRNLIWLGCFCAAGTIGSLIVYYKFSYYGDCWVNFIGWITVIVFIAAGNRFLNWKTGFSEYFNQASYPIYILHQSILVVFAYYVLRICGILWLQVLVICIGSFLFTVLGYCIIRHIPIVKKAVGVR